MIEIPRKPGQSVVIGDDVVITVVAVRGDKVRLAVELPAGMSLHRQEDLDALTTSDSPPARPGGV